MPGHRSRGKVALPATPKSPAPERRAAAAGRSPAELAVLPQGCASAMVCKRCKRNSGSGPISCRLVLTPATTGPCPHVSNARPETPCSLALSLADNKKGFPALPRTLAVTSRGDRIRTCDLVLPKHPRYQAAPRPVDRTLGGSWYRQTPPAGEGHRQRLDTTNFLD
jgi:hypothetical protein